MNSLRSKVLEIVERNGDAQVAHLQSLVREPSLLGREQRVQQMMLGAFRDLELEVHAFEPDVGRLHKLPGFSPVEWSYAGRPCIVGVQRAEASGGRSLVLNGHLDVVSPEPLGHWSHDPWGGEIAGERLYGRGALDMKAGVNAYVFAVRALKEAGVKLRGDLTLHAVIEEECTGNGTLACLDRGFTADGALIPEPFPTATVAQVGVLWCRVKVSGCAAHVKSAHAAVNAIEKAFVLIQGMRELEAEWNRTRHPAYAQHPWPINFNPGIIRGGDWASTVPAECVFQFRMGFYPGTPAEDATRAVLQHLLTVAQRDPWLKDRPPEIAFVGFQAEGTFTDFETNPVIQTLRGAHESIAGEKLKPGYSTATTDARFFLNHYGIPATCYGPRGSGLHGADEYVELPSLRETTQVIAAFMMDWCGVA